MNYPEGTKTLTVKTMKGFVTNEDVTKLSEDFAVRMKGLRNSLGDILLQRDFGTQQLFSALPTIPNYATSIQLFIQDLYTLEDQTDGTTHTVLVCLDPDPNNATTPAKAITGATNATPIQITSASHGYSNGDIVLVLGVVGNTAANGRWVIANVATNTFTLVNSIGNGNYVSGGLVTKTPNTRIFVDTSTNASGTWTEMTRTVTAVVNGTPGTGTGTANITTIKENSAAKTLGVNELIYWIVYNAAQGNYAVVTANGATSITCFQNLLGSDGLGWLNGNGLVFYQFDGTQKQVTNSSPYVFPMGINPQTRFNGVEFNRKVNLYLGNSATPPVMLNPLSIQNRPSRTYFWHNSSGGATVFPAGFYMESYGGLETSFTQYGTPGANNAAVTGHTFTNLTPWMSLIISGSVSSVFDTWNSVLGIYITVVYGYQESDPIFLAWLNSLGSDEHWYQTINETLQFNINPALMPKEVTGFNIYTYDVNGVAANVNALVLDAQDINFTQKYFLPVQSFDANFVFGATGTAGDPYGQVWQASYTYTANGGNSMANAIGTDIVTQLGHALILAGRTLIAPRFAASAKNTYGAVIAADQNDQTARLSSYDGDGSPEDDNFPDVSLDVNNAKQLIFLTGKGQLKGIGVNDESFYFFRNFNVEWVDLQAQTQRLAPCDFSSMRSLVSHDMGCSWAGEVGIYLIPRGTNQIKLINPLWKNFYDSTLLTDNGVTPYITQAYRDTIVSGYDRYFREIWFNCLVNKDQEEGGGTEWLNFRYSPERDDWNIRKLNINGGVGLTAFSRRQDGTTTLVYGQGILKYPNLTGYIYEDDVTSAGVSQSRGFETRIVIHLGSLSGILGQVSIHSMFLDYVGATTDGLGLFNLLVYANRETTPFDTEQFPLDGPTLARRIQYRGSLEQIRVEVNLPIIGNSDFLRMEISSITVAYVPNKRLGTR